MVKTAILVSGGGTNLQAIIDAHSAGDIPNCELTAVISSDPTAYALERARIAGIPGHVLKPDGFKHRREYSSAIGDMLLNLSIELVVLAGFNFVLNPALCEKFENRIINVHPSLIPAFCGEGCYGLRVHEMALDYGVKVSGATVHFVTAEPDAGPVILQKSVEVLSDDTPESLQRRIMEEAEWQILPRAIALFCQGRLHVDGRVVRFTAD